LTVLAPWTGDRKEYARARMMLEQIKTLVISANQYTPGTPEYLLFHRRYNITLAMTFVALGDHAAAARLAAAQADTLAGLGVSPLVATDTYNAACCLALCAPLAANDPALDDGRRRERAESYGRRAVELLRQSFVKGY